MTTVPFWAEITLAATAKNLEPALVAGLVETESSFDPDAWNPEPRYRYFWNVKTRAAFRRVSDNEMLSKFPPRDFPALAGDDQEWWGQQASWGLGQIMGAVAREHGFAGKYLPALCDPDLNLSITALHLAELVAWATRHYTGLSTQQHYVVTRSALASFNGGRAGNSPNGPLRNVAYADKVYARYDRIRKGL